MKKDHLEKELSQVLNDAENLYKASELHLASVGFLKKEGDKLIKKCDDITLSQEQREELVKQLDALKKRVENELIIHEKEVSKLVALENRFNQLKTIFETNQFED